MKKAVVFGFALLALVVSGNAYAGTASEDLAAVIENTRAFDGGDGSTINTAVDTSSVSS